MKSYEIIWSIDFHIFQRARYTTNQVWVPWAMSSTPWWKLRMGKRPLFPFATPNSHAFCRNPWVETLCAPCWRRSPQQHQTMRRRCPLCDMPTGPRPSKFQPQRIMAGGFQRWSQYFQPTFLQGFFIERGYNGYAMGNITTLVIWQVVFIRFSYSAHRMRIPQWQA